ncbi:MAG TPA: hypothetical protein VK462_04870 [Nitrososphaeraceae archaeon]|nr:hypothetical protein [Nitrososphaeraceae archaeon]
MKRDLEEDLKMVEGFEFSNVSAKTLKYWLNEVKRLREALDVYKKNANDFEEMYKQEHKEKNELIRQIGDVFK